MQNAMQWQKAAECFAVEKRSKERHPRVQFVTRRNFVTSLSSKQLHVGFPSIFVSWNFCYKSSPCSCAVHKCTHSCWKCSVQMTPTLSRTLLPRQWRRKTCETCATGGLKIWKSDQLQKKKNSLNSLLKSEVMTDMALSLSEEEPSTKICDGIFQMPGCRRLRSRLFFYLRAAY